MPSNIPSKLATYEFNIRSFHPEKDFGWSGLYFQGDNRGFSLKPSGTGEVTSRIWHKFLLHTATGALSDHFTVSDPSKARWSDKSEIYNTDITKPQSHIYQFPLQRIKKVYQSKIKGRYWGENYAMPYSKEIKEYIGATYVPSLDVNYMITVDVNPEGHYIDIVAYIKGDAFPNAEAFVVDPKGNAVFLGVHVRKGAAPITLGLNSDYPMIACAIRIKLDNEGAFKGPIKDILVYHREKLSTAPLYSIEAWNQKHLRINSNNNHCMGFEELSQFKDCF